MFFCTSPIAIRLFGKEIYRQMHRQIAIAIADSKRIADNAASRSRTRCRTARRNDRFMCYGGTGKTGRSALWYKDERFSGEFGPTPE